MAMMHDDVTDVVNCHALLGLSSDATQQQVRVAWRRMAKLAHPDHGGSSETFQRARAAYAALRDRERRETVVATPARHTSTGYDRYGANEYLERDRSVLLATL